MLNVCFQKAGHVELFFVTLSFVGGLNKITSIELMRLMSIVGIVGMSYAIMRE